MNLNDIKTTGLYILENAVENKPEPTLLEVHTFTSGHTWQIVKFSDGLLLRRPFNLFDNGIWGLWEFFNKNKVWEKYDGIISNTANIIVSTNEKEG